MAHGRTPTSPPWSTSTTPKPTCRYVDQALAGEEVVIARAGKPLVRLVPLAAAVGPRRGGFLRGQATIRADLKAAFQQEIEEMFYGE